MSKVKFFIGGKLPTIFFLLCQWALISSALELPQSIFSFSTIVRDPNGMNHEGSFQAIHYPVLHPPLHTVHGKGSHDPLQTLKETKEEKEDVTIQNVLHEFMDRMHQYQLKDACSDELALYCEDIDFDETMNDDKNDKIIYNPNDDNKNVEKYPNADSVDQVKHELDMASKANDATSQIRFMKEIDKMISSIRCLQNNEDALNQYCYHSLQEILLQQELEQNLQQELYRSQELLEDVFENLILLNETAGKRIIVDETLDTKVTGKMNKESTDSKLFRKLHVKENNPHSKKVGKEEKHKKYTKNDDKSNEVTYTSLAYPTHDHEDDEDNYNHGASSMYLYYFCYILGLVVLLVHGIFESRKQITFKRMWEVVSNQSRLREEMEKKIKLQIPIKPPKKHFCIKLLTFSILLVLLLFIFQYLMLPYDYHTYIGDTLVIFALLFLLGCILYQNYRTPWGVALPPQTVAIIPSNVTVVSEHTTDTSHQKIKEKTDRNFIRGDPDVEVTTDTVSLTENQSNSSTSPSLQRQNRNHNYSLEITANKNPQASYI